MDIAVIASLKCPPGLCQESATFAPGATLANASLKLPTFENARPTVKLSGLRFAGPGGAQQAAKQLQQNWHFFQNSMARKDHTDA